MSETSERPSKETRQVRIPADLDAALTAWAIRDRVPKGEILRRLTEKYLEKDDWTKIIQQAGAGGKGMEDLKEMLMFKFMAGGQNTPPQTNPLMEVLAMKTLTQPDPMMLWMIMQSSKQEGGGMSDQMERMLQLYLDGQKDMKDTLEKMIFRRDLQEGIGAAMEKAETIGEKAERDQTELAKMLADRLGSIERQIQGLSEEERATLSQEIDEFGKTQKALKEFAKSVGMSSEDIVTPEGGVRWDNVVNRMFDVAEKWAERYPKEKPDRKAVEPIPTPTREEAPEPLPAAAPSTRDVGAEEATKFEEKVKEKLTELRAKPTTFR